MEKITISEAMAMKAKMEGEIFIVVNGFQEKTGLNVQSIHINSINLTNVSEQKKTFLTQIECKITL